MEDFDGPGETQLVLALELDGSSSLMLTNAGWSSVADQQYPSLAVLVNGNVYDGAGGVGVEVLGRKGFAMNMPAEFLNDVAAGRALDVYLGDQVVDSLSLTGSADGVSALRRCIVGVRREHEAAERERRRFEGLPRDPFAPKHTGN
ncbi:hypothetical protein [Brevundimonas lenta]|uniref:hypothetical protein n=1 Tax=Brevundimonas lenta TaxID=424796 RepID=UPI001605B61A|nr:hypothetical protein [Brevundimonas lenta]